MDDTIGLLSIGAYIPRLRLSRQLIADANRWFNPALRGMARGERAVCSWDEDTVTMAVEASRQALAGSPLANAPGAPGAADGIGALYLASTTLPFDDRQNSGMVVAALNLPTATRTMDTTGSARAATSALRAAFDSVAAGGPAALVASAEHRRTRAASAQEMLYGDGAAAAVVGRGEPIALLVGAVTETLDFVPQFRASDREHDYAWEERWIRDEGYLKIVPVALERLFAETGVKPSEITHFCLPCTLRRVPEGVAKRAGISASAVRDNLGERCGDTGSAHPLLMLAHALEDAKPGDRIVVASFGEGCDALLFEVTGALAARPFDGVSNALARRAELAPYQRFLAVNETVEVERGMRAEVDKGTPLSVLYRNREMVFGLVGGRCRQCGTHQFPSGRYCVNPECNALDSQDDYRFADVPGTVNSYTADSLTYCPDPPAYYGMVQFDGGGRLMADFSDIDPERLDVGLRMRMVFRIKDIDAQRGFVRYFWKAAPLDA
ncbi:MAG: OB-fold domain-containing protein [Burkholderiaceae bacterium]|nr:OB-fold domain-containing protein [Burkholderiaceae bacterium]